MTTCTHGDCDNDAEFALLWSDGEFSRVYRAHESADLEQGDYHPHVCEGHRPLYAEIFQVGEFRRPSDA